MSKEAVVNELHKAARRNFPRRRVIIKDLDDLWQADLVEMGTYARENNGHHFLLTVIDTFSKYAWAEPVKNKSGVEVKVVMERILKSGRIPKNLQTDDGKEFYNKIFQKLMQDHQINHYSTYSILKASIVERFNRTLKGMMWKEFSKNGSYRWIDIVKKLINDYNNKKHRTIQMKPSDVNYSNKNILLKTVYNRIKISKIPKYKIGDYVRISKYKHIFEKGYTPNWTTEIFRIKSVQNTNPVTYLLEDFEGHPIKGGFYDKELLKTKYPQDYLIEKVLKKKGNKYFVKWLGFPEKHNSWINKSEIL